MISLHQFPHDVRVIEKLWVTEKQKEIWVSRQKNT
jgi:hypothetical protein